MIEPALRVWLGELFPERTAEGEPLVDIEAMTQVIMSQLFSFFIGHLFRPEAERDELARRQAEAIATLAFPHGS